MNEPSGRRLPAPFAHYDPDTLCWRTWQPSLLPESLPEQPPTWPRSGMWDLGAAYELPTSEPPTDEHASSSLLPTPDAGRFNDGQTVEVYRERLARLKEKHNNGNGAGTPLAMGAGKTVQAWDEWTENGHGPSLAIEALRLLATPTAAIATGGPPQDSKGKRDLRLDLLQDPL